MELHANLYLRPERPYAKEYGWYFKGVYQKAVQSNIGMEKMNPSMRPRAFLTPVSSDRKSEFLKLARRSRAFHRDWVNAPASEKEFAEYLKRTRRKTSRSFFIVDQEGKNLVGVINISQIVRGNFRSAFLGYYVFKPFANQGYMSEALREAIKEAFTRLNLHRLEANIQPANRASKKVVRKLGFRLEGFSPRFLQVGGKWRDHERWAITIEDRGNKTEAEKTGIEKRGFMNPISEDAFKLNLPGLKKRALNKANTEGALLAACSAHDADPKAQVQVIRYLIRAGANPNETDKNGVTPLHRAVRFRNLAAVKELIRIGVQVDVQDKKSKSTALHRAVVGTGAPKTSGKTGVAKEIIEALLQAGADPAIRNKLGKYAADYVKDEKLKKKLAVPE